MVLRSQAEDLEAAAVGEDGTLPVQGVQAACSVNEFVAWPQIEMISVAEDNLRLGFSRSS